MCTHAIKKKEILINGRNLENNGYLENIYYFCRLMCFVAAMLLKPKTVPWKLSNTNSLERR